MGDATPQRFFRLEMWSIHRSEKCVYCTERSLIYTKSSCSDL